MCASSRTCTGLRRTCRPQPATWASASARRHASKTDSRSVDGQIETYESVYELSSQRISEFRAARQGFILESVIIVLLAAETVLLLAEMLWYVE